MHGEPRWDFSRPAVAAVDREGLHLAHDPDYVSRATKEMVQPCLIRCTSSLWLRCLTSSGRGVLRRVAAAQGSPPDRAAVVGRASASASKDTNQPQVLHTSTGKCTDKTCLMPGASDPAGGDGRGP